MQEATKLPITGKAFELGQSRVVTAKVIGIETTLTRPIMVKGELDAPLDKLALEAGEVARRESRDRPANPSEPVTPRAVMVRRAPSSAHAGMLLRR